MSVLEEPPMDRIPIQTYVMEYNEELVREAISRELARGGQAYYVYNRVKEIADVATKIAELVPEANVAYAHGQMKETELENIMYKFINGEIDVLVSTTIIETGLDISNVNTMIIHDADNMGPVSYTHLDVYKRQEQWKLFHHIERNRTMEQLKAVILAAGKGTRMKSDLPKVVHTIEGKCLVDYAIDAAIGAGADDICLVVGYKHEVVELSLIHI